MSGVICQVSHVIFNFFLIYFFLQSGEASRWRVFFYQQSLPRLVYLQIMKTFKDLIKHEIKNMPSSIFKNLVKSKAVLAGIYYRKYRQMKCEKGTSIQYQTLEIQGYLKPCSNLNLKDRKYILSLRCEMNPIKNNFERIIKIKQEYCIKAGLKEINYEHIMDASFELSKSTF